MGSDSPDGGKQASHTSGKQASRSGKQAPPGSHCSKYLHPQSRGSKVTQPQSLSGCNIVQLVPGQLEQFKQKLFLYPSSVI